MENIYQLKGKNAKAFYYDMTHIDYENQKKIDDFLKNKERIKFFEEPDGLIKAKLSISDEELEKIRKVLLKEE